MRGSDWGNEGGGGDKNVDSGGDAGDDSGGDGRVNGWKWGGDGDWDGDDVGYGGDDRMMIAVLKGVVT